MTVVLTTNEGLLFLAIGNAVGAALSLILFSLTVVSFPLLLDREVDFVTAMGMRRGIFIGGWWCRWRKRGAGRNGYEAVEHKASTVLFDRKRFRASKAWRGRENGS